MKGTIASKLLFAALAAAAGTAAAASFHDGQRAYDAGQFEEAHRAWAPLAEAGDPEAQAGLGLLYDLGSGAPKDPAMAYAWYRRAAEAGLARAQFNVAVMLDSGIVVARDPAQAATWYAKAAAPPGHGQLSPIQPGAALCVWGTACRGTSLKRRSGTTPPPPEA